MACCILDLLVAKRQTKNEAPEVSGAASFGAHLRNLRERAGRTQEELAFQAGLSPHAVGSLERGVRRRPHPHTVRSLADALGLSDEERAALLATVPKRSRAASSGRQVGTSPSALSTLPNPATPLLGRERELEDITALLIQQNVRLLTLTGIGGVGKTRLAVEVVREVAHLFPDGTAFVGLASLADPTLVISTILRSLGVPEAEVRTSKGALIDYLREKKLLLVLDNFEHLLQAAPEVTGLIEACPSLSVLATSRAPLRVRSEREYPVSPLGLPASTRSSDQENVLESPSGRLFLERARAASPAFGITSENAAAVAQICWRLAGLPLALELVAAKLRFMTAPMLLSRLDHALESAWARDLPERQRTMRAALNWSHDLLSGPQQELLRRLSVFSGGFTLQAGEVVGAAGAIRVGDVLEHLEALAEQSLVTVDLGADMEARYGMLEPVRQYAHEMLEENGEEEEVRRRHAEYYLALAETAHQHLRGPEQVSWLNRLEPEHGNVRAAMGWFLERRDTGTAARLGWALWLFWYLRSHWGEGLRWMKEVLSSEEGTVTTLARARASCVAGIMLFRLGAGEPASARLEEALVLFRSLSDAAGTMMSALFTGLMRLGSGDTKRAERLLKEGLDLCRSLGDAWSEAVMLSSLGLIPLARGDYEGAKGYFQRALSIGRALGNPLVMLPPLYQLAQVAQVRDDHHLAAERYREALALGLELGDIADIALLLQGLAECAVAGGAHVYAGRLYGASEAAFESAGTAFRAPYHISPSFHERYLAGARDKLGDRAWSEVLEEGRRMRLEVAVKYALGGEEVSPT